MRYVDVAARGQVARKKAFVACRERCSSAISCSRRSAWRRDVLQAYEPSVDTPVVLARARSRRLDPDTLEHGAHG